MQAQILLSAMPWEYEYSYSCAIKTLVYANAYSDAYMICFVRSYTIIFTSSSDGYGDNLIFLQLIHFYETANFLRRSLKKLLLRIKNKFFNIKQAKKNTKIPTLQTENLQSLFIAAMHVSYLKA